MRKRRKKKRKLRVRPPASEPADLRPGGDGGHRVPDRVRDGDGSVREHRADRLAAVAQAKSDLATEILPGTADRIRRVMAKLEQGLERGRAFLVRDGEDTRIEMHCDAREQRLSAEALGKLSLDVLAKCEDASSHPNVTIDNRSVTVHREPAPPTTPEGREDARKALLDRIQALRPSDDAVDSGA